MSKIAIYPGTFDPITFGHIDLIQKSLKIVDKIIVAISDSNQKDYLFTSEERIRFHSIPEVSNSLTEAARPAKGMTFREIIQKMPEIKVLNLAPN